MGGVCSAGTRGDNKNRQSSGKLRSKKSFSRRKQSSKSDHSANNYGKDKEKNLNSNGLPLCFSSELKSMPPSKTGSSKVMQRNSFLGRAGMMGLERAVDVLDTLGSSVSNLNPGSGFISGVTSSRGIKISILAFEVANTIAKGAALLQSLSEESLTLAKKEILHSKGVEKLVSADAKELLQIAASDKREELDVFSKEVVRFGNKCKDLQWHNLDRYFSKLGYENSQERNLRDDAESGMQELVILAQHTSELYHELQALDRFEQDYRRKLAEVEALNLSRKGEGVSVLYNELKQQKKLVRSLQKKSLWSRTLEEIMEKLVDIVSYIHQAITDVFGNNGSGDIGGRSGKAPERLGEAGLALHYANLIQQIDSIASRPSSLPPNIRDALYNALPASVKKSLRSQLHTLDPKEKMSMSEIKAEMEKSLHWLVPLAVNTTKAHQGFGWVGEWANSGKIEYGKGKAAENNSNPARLQTLYHADKQKTDSYILDLITLLQRLLISARKRDHSVKHPPYRSPTQTLPSIPISKTQLKLSPDYSNRTQNTELSLEDRFLLEKACRRRFNPGLSKSQEFVSLKKIKRVKKIWALSRSTGNSPRMDFSGRKRQVVPKSQNRKALDILDGLDSSF